MGEIRNVKIEMLRSGPAHNQLLSPLTPYLALCGADGPVTVQMPFEHRQLLNRLQRLRYDINGTPVADSQREAEMQELGESVGLMLGQIPALLSELSNARADGGRLVHLRLSLSAFELGMVPFEAAIAPAGFPGSGDPLFLQSHTPIVITREVRRGRPLPIEWNRKPRILFAFASPGSLPPVPAQEHLQAIRRAIDPWVKIKDSPEERVQEVKKILTVLPNASLEQIREECLAAEYTHVHILAHGKPFNDSMDHHYGVVLCSDTDPNGEVVDGKRLAIVLTARDSKGNAKYQPNVVTLATCDSGNIESVLIPGGSIAHELHAAGIPWVIASQFPLWMRASSIAAEVFYSGLLGGDDPRWVLHYLRQRLRTDSAGTHDWASIVCYATVPWNFEQQVDDFRDKRIRGKLDIKFDRIDELVGANSDDSQAAVVPVPTDRDAELESLCKSIRADLKAWCAEPVTATSAKQKAERLGMSAASEKRIGIAYFQKAKREDSAAEIVPEKREKYESEGKRAYEAACDFYYAALKAEPCNHWVITQYLSILATPLLADSQEALKDLRKRYGSWWNAARQIAEWQLHKANDKDRAWALGTLAELTMLGVVYGGTGFNRRHAEKEIQNNCAEMLKLVDRDAFQIFSTRRQFRRYLDHWSRKEWDALASSALQALDN